MPSDSDNDLIETRKLAEALGRDVPPEIEHLLNWGVDKFRAALRKQFGSVIVFGGLTLGDYSPRWSNVNVCVALAGDISADLAAYLVMISEEMKLRFIKSGQGGWNSGQTLEGVLIPAKLLADPALSAQVYCFGRQGGKTLETNLKPFDRELIARNGITIAGDEIECRPADEEALRRQTEMEILEVESPPLRMLDSPVWLLERLFWLARALAFWKNGGLASKRDALRDQIGPAGRFRDAFHFALGLREEGSVAALEHEQDTRLQFTLVGQEAAVEVRKHAGIASS